MKSLLDIQKDIRKLESNVKDITNSIKNINLDIQNIRNSSEEAELDFSKIEILAKKLNFGKHPLSKIKHLGICGVYLQMLLNIVVLDSNEEITINRLVFIQWLKIQSHIECSLEDLYKESLKMQKKSYQELVNKIPQNYKEYFVVDALIVANIAGNANEAIYQYIADIISILEISLEKVKELALISRVVLSQNINEIDQDELRIIIHSIEEYDHYIKNNIQREIIETLRIMIKFKTTLKR